MDDAARLVTELQDKLAELDGKVAAYRRDMLTEFHKHMDECLKKYPDSVSGEVSQAIAASMSTGRYSALDYPSRDAPDSPAIDRSAWDGRKSPPPILRHTSGTPKESPRDPHAREKEFHGLFTPTYLPLLESNKRALQSPPMSPPPMSPPLPTSGETALALSADNVKKVAESKPAVFHHLEDRPGAVRRMTDQSTSSLDSSGSDSKTRRSALRRSSSSVKGSPRRVRFEFEGEEVFPASSSPKAPTMALDEESGAEPQPEAEAPAVATENESTAYSGTSLLDAVGEEDSLPKPRKVSSTQALQALTRSPLEEGTTWREVNADTEAPAKMNGTKQPAKTADRPTKTDSQATIRANGTGCFAHRQQPGPPLEDSAIYDDEDEDEDENVSDDEFLSIPVRRKSSSTPSPSTPPLPSTVPPLTRVPNGATPASKTTASEVNRTHSADDDGLNPLFDFDDEAGGSSASRSQNPQKYISDPESDDEDPTPPGRLRNEVHQQPAAAASTSAAAQIPPMSPSSVLFGHSVGSYMGRSVVMPPVKNPQLYDEIAGMDDVELYVGSIKDLSAAQAASMGTSYRAPSLARGGVPMSFSERLALEDEMERRGAAGEKGEGA
jgi:hypothetical protein